MKFGTPSGGGKGKNGYIDLDFYGSVPIGFTEILENIQVCFDFYFQGILFHFALLLDGMF